MSGPWPAARRVTAGFAVAVAAATGGLAAVLADSEVRTVTTVAALLHIACTATAVLRPGSEMAVVVSGVALAWPVVLSSGAAFGVPVMAGVVLGTEAAAAAAEHAVVVAHAVEPGLRRARSAALVAGAAAAVTAVAVAVPGPGGLLGTAVAGLAASAAMLVTVTERP